MSRNITLFALLLFIGYAQASFSQAIDTLLFENFETDPDTYIEPNFPNGDDETWVNYDQDGYNDASGAGRPGEWFWSVGFADVDTTTLVYASNSWTTPATLVANYLVLPPITISDASAQLSWKSAPYQTPRYLDGYYVVASTDCNIEECFTDTLFKAAEFLSAEILDTDSGFSHYNFSSGWVHGEDGTYIEYHNDSARFVGILQPHSVSLAAYMGQTIYIALVHGTVDDNLLSIDDLLVTQNKITGVETYPAENTSVKVYPNPANATCTLDFFMPQTAPVTTTLIDASGRTVLSTPSRIMIKGQQKIQLNVSQLASGSYEFFIRYGNEMITGKVVVQ